MLDFFETTKPRLRKKLLAYFFTNPTSNLYLREIASILKEDPGNLSKELSRLEKEGVFVSSTRGNQKYFSLNEKYPLYKELKSVIFKTIGVEGSLRRLISEIEGINLAFIYGSFASAKENNISDIDLLIIGNPDEDRLMEKIDTLEKMLLREINYSIYSKKEFKEKIREKGSFIQNIFKRPKIILKGSLDGI